MRKARIFLLIMLAGFVPPTKAQCNLSPGDPIRQVMGPVCRQKAELDGYWRTRAILAEVGSWASELGDQTRYAYGASRAAAEAGYGYYGYGQPVGRGVSPIQGAILGGSLGANIAGLVTGERKWMGIGAAGGAVVGALLAGRGRDGQPLDCGKRNSSRERKDCEVLAAEQERYDAEARADRLEHEAQAEAAELEERRLRGGYLRNATRYPLEVTDCGERVVVLRPGQRVQALEARCGYEGTMLVPSPSIAGVREERQAAFIVSDNAGGWVFHAPAIKERGGR